MHYELSPNCRPIAESVVDRSPSLFATPIHYDNRDPNTASFQEGLPDDFVYNSQPSPPSADSQSQVSFEIDEEECIELFNSDFNSQFLSRIQPGDLADQSEHTSSLATSTRLQQASVVANQVAALTVTATAIPGLESGNAFLLPPDFNKGRFCFTKNDRAMMRLYNICDEAGSLRYLMDQILRQLKVESKRSQFDPIHYSITKRDAFMARIHRKFPSPPPV